MPKRPRRAGPAGQRSTCGPYCLRLAEPPGSCAEVWPGHVSSVRWPPALRCSWSVNKFRPYLLKLIIIELNVGVISNLKVESDGQLNLNLENKNADLYTNIS